MSGKCLLFIGQTVDGKTFNGMTPLKKQLMGGTILKRMQHFTLTMKDLLLDLRGEMTEIKFTDLTDQEAHVKIHANDYFNVLWELDEHFREQMKHHNLSVDEYDTTEAHREKLNELMEINGVSLLDIN
jgi:hypothetical protein